MSSSFRLLCKSWVKFIGNSNSPPSLSKLLTLDGNWMCFRNRRSTAYWLHVAQRWASWLVGKAPVQGLRSEWELDDDRLQCFNIGEESKKERKGKWERRCKRVLLSDNFFLAFKSDDKVDKVEHKSLWVCIRVLPILRTILSHCLCEARLDAMIPVSLAEMTAQWAPCLADPRDISSLHGISIFFPPNTLKCPSVVSCCLQWQWVWKEF